MVLLAKVDGEFYAVGNKCSHFKLPLSAGLLFEDKVYCPFHFASFSVKTGNNEFGPVFKGIPTYEVKVEGGRVKVSLPKEGLGALVEIPQRKDQILNDKTYVILGAGPAGLSAAQSLRQGGFGGKIVLISKEKVLPYDRTMLTKIVMKAKSDSIKIKNETFFKDNKIDLMLGEEACDVDDINREIKLKSEQTIKYDKLLITTGTRYKNWNLN